MNPITFRNVNAPSFSGLSQGLASGADSFNRGISTLSNLAGNIDTEQRKKATDDVLNSIRGIDTIAGLDAARESGAFDNLDRRVDSNAVSSALRGQTGTIRDNLTSQFNFDRTQERQADLPGQRAISLAEATGNFDQARELSLGQSDAGASLLGVTAAQNAAEATARATATRLQTEQADIAVNEVLSSATSNDASLETATAAVSERLSGAAPQIRAAAIATLTQQFNARGQKSTQEKTRIDQAVQEAGDQFDVQIQQAKSAKDAFARANKVSATASPTEKLAAFGDMTDTILAASPDAVNADEDMLGGPEIIKQFQGYLQNGIDVNGTTRDVSPGMLRSLFQTLVERDNIFADEGISTQVLEASLKDLISDQRNFDAQNDIERDRLDAVHSSLVGNRSAAINQVRTSEGQNNPRRDNPLDLAVARRR